MPKVSIFSSNYNREKYLSSTIESVLSQNFDDFEYFIVDDWSTDNSVEIISSYVQRDNRIKFWDRGKKWHIDHFNFLLSQVSQESEYITWIDTDDEFIWDSIMYRLELFQKYSDVVMIYNNLQNINESWDVIYREYPQKLEAFLFDRYKEKIDPSSILHLLDYYREKPILSFWSLMYRKKFLKKIWIINPTDNPFYLLWDLDLFFRTIAQYPSYWEKRKLLRYRVHPDQVSITHQKQAEKDYRMVLRYLFKKWLLSKKDYIILEQGQRKQLWY